MVTKISDKTSNDAVPSAEWNWVVDLIDGTGVSSANLIWEQATTSGTALFTHRNLASANTNSPLVGFSQYNTGDDQPVVQILQSAGSYDFVKFVGTSSAGTGQPVSTENTGTFSRAVAINVNGTRLWLKAFTM